MLSCRPARREDLDSWLELVAEVEPLFGPMPDFRTHAVRGVRRGTALVVIDDGLVVAGALLGRDDDPHHITWLAVRDTRRRSGAGTLLMRAILDRWPIGDIQVVTFDDSAPGGRPARGFYEHFGFARVGAGEPAPDGGGRDLYVLGDPLRRTAAAPRRPR